MTPSPGMPLARFKALLAEGAPPEDALVWWTVGGGFLRKSLDLAARTVEVVISTGVVDRSQDQLDPAGWDLDEYKTNPVVLADHCHSLAGIVGKALSVGVVGNQLRALDQFATADENPYADTCFKLIAGGYARGVSPGFRYLEWNYDAEQGGIRSSKQRLYEHSIVVLPDNQEALVAAKAAGIDLVPMRDWSEQWLDEWTRDTPTYLPKQQVEMVFKTIGKRGGTGRKTDKAACMQTTVWLDDPPMADDAGDGMQPTAAAAMPCDDDPMMDMTEDDMKALTDALAAHTAALAENTAAQKALLAQLTQKTVPVESPVAAAPAAEAQAADASGAVPATTATAAVTPPATDPTPKAADATLVVDADFDLETLDAKGLADFQSLIRAATDAAVKQELGAALTTLTGRLPESDPASA